MGIIDSALNVVSGVVSDVVKGAVKTVGNILSNPTKLADTGLNVLGEALSGSKTPTYKKTTLNSNTNSGSSTNNAAQNPIEIAKIASAAVGLPKNKVPEVLNTAKLIAPKDQNGKTQLTAKSVITAANMVASSTSSKSSIKINYQG